MSYLLIHGRFCKALVVGESQLPVKLSLRQLACVLPWLLSVKRESAGTELTAEPVLQICAIRELVAVGINRDSSIVLLNKSESARVSSGTAPRKDQSRLWILVRAFSPATLTDVDNVTWRSYTMSASPKPMND